MATTTTTKDENGNEVTRIEDGDLLLVVECGEVSDEDGLSGSWGVRGTTTSDSIGILNDDQLFFDNETDARAQVAEFVESFTNR